MTELFIDRYYADSPVNSLCFVCLKGEEGWEDVNDEEEGIDASGSPFAPASDYLGTIFYSDHK